MSPKLWELCRTEYNMKYRTLRRQCPVFWRKKKILDLTPFGAYRRSIIEHPNIKSQLYAVLFLRFNPTNLSPHYHKNTTYLIQFFQLPSGKWKCILLAIKTTSCDLNTDKNEKHDNNKRAAIYASKKFNWRRRRWHFQLHW